MFILFLGQITLPHPPTYMRHTPFVCRGLSLHRLFSSPGIFLQVYKGYVHTNIHTYIYIFNKIYLILLHMAVNLAIYFHISVTIYQFSERIKWKFFIIYAIIYVSAAQKTEEIKIF